MNDLSGAAQQCWAKVAAERFDIEGELEASIDIGAPTQVAIGKDTTHSPKLAACMHDVLVAYPWAPPLRGQAIRLPFKWRAPDGQSVIDRQLVPWTTQGDVGVAVLLDENNTGNDMISVFELAIHGSTGFRFAQRPELWYFLGAGEIRMAKPSRAVRSGDMMYVAKDGAREIAGTLHAIVAMVPGGREGTARAGALPTGIDGERKKRAEPQILLVEDAKKYGPVTIFAEDATIHDKQLAGSVLVLAAGAAVPEHVHANETEVLYVLAGSGTLTVAGVAIAVTPTSVIQIPKNTKHAFTAATAFRAVQFYTPAGPEQRFKK
jgi:quercetin dioxygenase-like cupin family protein